MRKIFEHFQSFSIGMIIGTIIGFAFATFMYEVTIISVNESYDNGYKKAQLECIQLIKNTK